ncbi:MAG: hypothetical protein HQK70_15170, partial [Desulfamplus sp.]|nr:hypothetical protein [Desulfamplus sp.]
SDDDVTFFDEPAKDSDSDDDVTFFDEPAKDSDSDDDVTFFDDDDDKDKHGGNNTNGDT